MLKIKLLVSDWDGTIADSLKQIIQCKHFIANKYGLVKPSEQLIRAVIGREFINAMQACFPDVGERMLRKICHEFHEIMQQDDYRTSLFPDAISTLKQLKARGTRLAIATSKARIELDTSLNHLKLVDIFDLTCCAEEYSPKPNPEMLSYILDYFNIDPSKCIMLGDTTTDIIFANAANVNAICVTFGAHERKKLETNKPMAFINHWKELLDILED